MQHDAQCPSGKQGSDVPSHLDIHKGYPMSFVSATEMGEIEAPQTPLSTALDSPSRINADSRRQERNQYRQPPVSSTSS